MAEHDVVIVGAGILGLSTAYHIKKTHPDTDILVIDKLSGPGQANTAARALFSTAKNNVIKST